MSNHYHLVIHIDKDKAEKLSNEQVIERWGSLHKQPVLIRQYQTNSLTSEAAGDNCQPIINGWRLRTADLNPIRGRRALIIEITRSIQPAMARLNRSKVQGYR